MKPLSDLIHRTPWLVLLVGGVLTLVALAFFVTPYHIIDYRDDDRNPVERQAIKREIDNAFADNALDIARGVLLGMRRSTNDAARREELDTALESLDEARQELRDAGIEALRAKREAGQDARQALKEATDAIKQAQKDAEKALTDAGVDSETVRKALEESLTAAKKAQEEARIAAEESAEKTRVEMEQHAAQIVDENGKRRIVINGGGGKTPHFSFELDPSSTPPVPPAKPGKPGEPGFPFAPSAGAGAGAGATAMPPMPPMVLPADRKAEIRRNVTHDLYRILTGAGLLLVFVPIFILTIVSKFFIDRSRAALRMADLKRKEAEYHRMSQQVTAAKLSALQAQVEPHFLYNTLASVQALTEVDPNRANAMTGHLIQYLRNALPKMRESVSTVGQEVELVRAYLNILQMRMGKRLAFTIDVPPEMNEAPFPPLMLPSLVENAIKHGLEPQREGGEVRIRAEEVNGRVRMIVADTGRGFSETPGAGVGLANIRERLAALYGDEGKLTLEANVPQGVVATIEVPRRPIAPAASGSDASPPPASAEFAGPRTRTQRVLGAMGTAERVWRKSLSFTFVGLVVAAAILAALAVVGIATGSLPVHLGSAVPITGAKGAFLGTVGIAVAFIAVVLALALVIAVIYGLGFVFVALAIFVPIMILVGIFPVLAPFLLLGLGVWWFVRRSRRKAGEAAAVADATTAAAAAQSAPTEAP